MGTNEKDTQDVHPQTKQNSGGFSVAMLDRVRQSFAWTAYKFTSTVLDDIWPQALLFTGVAVMVTCISKFTSTQLQTHSITLTVLGVVVSLVVSFHTNNSYLRWWEGRNVWTNITSTSRQLAMLIWLQIPNEINEKEDENKDKDKKEGDKYKDKKDDRVDKEGPKSRDLNHDSDSDLKDSPEHVKERKAAKELEADRRNIRGILIKKGQSAGKQDRQWKWLYWPCETRRTRAGASKLLLHSRLHIGFLF